MDVKQTFDWRVTMVVNAARLVSFVRCLFGYSAVEFAHASSVPNRDAFLREMIAA